MSNDNFQYGSRRNKTFDYSYFILQIYICIQRANQKVKIIVAGDFEQVLPEKVRARKGFSKHSNAVDELWDGNRLTLTNCSRSDSTLLFMW